MTIKMIILMIIIKVMMMIIMIIILKMMMIHSSLTRAHIITYEEISTLRILFFRL